MKRILLYTHFISGAEKRAFFPYLSRTNKAMFTYLTAIINGKKLYSTKWPHGTKGSYTKEFNFIYVNFIKALLHNRLGLDINYFKKHEDIIKFLEDFRGDQKPFTRHYISKLKKGDEFVKVDASQRSIDFADYVQKTFPNFNREGFMKAPELYIFLQEIQNTNPGAMPSEEDYYEWKERRGLATRKKKAINKTYDTNKAELVPKTINKKDKPVAVESVVKETKSKTKVVPSSTDQIETKKVKKPKKTKIISATATATAAATVSNVINNVINNVIGPTPNSPANSTVNKDNYTEAQSNNLFSRFLGFISLGVFGKHSKLKIKLISFILFMQKVLLLEDIYTGIAYLFIQIPYLVLALLAFLDNPELLKKLTEWNTATVEWFDSYFKLPSKIEPQDTELPPIDFEQMGLDIQPLVDTNTQDKSVISEAKALVQDVTAGAVEQLKDKASSIKESVKQLDGKVKVEPMEYFDYYDLEEEYDNTKPILTDVTKPETTRGSNIAYAEVINKPINNLYEQTIQSPNITEANNRDNYKVNWNWKAGKSNWWFSMLDFNNLNYFPSLFDKNINTKDTNLSLNDIQDFISNNNSNKAITQKSSVLRNIDTGVSSEVSKQGTKKVTFQDIFNIFSDNKRASIYSYSTTPTNYDKYFYWDPAPTRETANKLLIETNVFSPDKATATNPEDKEITIGSAHSEESNKIPSMNSSPIQPLMLDHDLWENDGISTKSNRSIWKRFTDKLQGIFNTGEQVTINIEQPTPRLDPVIPTRDSGLSDIINFKDLKTLDTNLEVPKETNVFDLYNTEKEIVKLDKNIGNFNAISIDYQHKINEFNKQIAQFLGEKNELKEKISKDTKNSNLNQFDLQKLTAIKSKISYFENLRDQATEIFNANEKDLSKLKAEKSTLVERSIHYKKLLGNLAITPGAN